MRGVLLGVLLAATACSGGSKPKPSTGDSDQVATPVIDAGPRWFALPVDGPLPPDARPQGKAIAPDDLPLLGPDTDAPEARLYAVDVPVGLLIWLPIRFDFDGSKPSMFIAPTTDALLRGRANGANPAELASAIRAGRPDVIPAAIPGTRGRADTVALSFADAPVVDLFRLFGDVERRNYVLARPAPAVDQVTILVKQSPSEVVAAAVAKTVGRELEIHGNVSYVRDATTPALDPALIKKRGKALDLDVKDAEPGEIYAALSAVGADVGGAACGGTPRVTIRLKHVKAGLAAAVVAALSGVSPTPSRRCVMADADRTRVTALRGIVAIGDRRAAIVDEGATVTLLRSDHATADGIGTSFITLPGDQAVPLHPAVIDTTATAPGVDGDFRPPAWVAQLEHGRLAATLNLRATATALVELPDGTWHAVGSGSRFGVTATIHPGLLQYSYEQEDPSTGRVTSTGHELVLRER